MLHECFTHLVDCRRQVETSLIALVDFRERSAQSFEEAFVEGARGIIGIRRFCTISSAIPMATSGDAP